MTPELVTDGMRLLMTQRRRVQPIGGLTTSQILWCEQHLKGFAWPRVQRLANKPAVPLTDAELKRLMAEYQPKLVDEARGKVEVV
jgi:hypothetical protein